MQTLVEGWGIGLWLASELWSCGGGNFFVGVMHLLQHVGVVMDDYSFRLDVFGQPILSTDI